MYERDMWEVLYDLQDIGRENLNEKEQKQLDFLEAEQKRQEEDEE